MSGEHIFVDTNILVYAHDADGGEKHLRAQECIRRLWDAPYPPAISNQVLQELYATLARKKASSKQCREIVSIYLEWEVISSDIALMNQGMEVCERFKLSIWDSLIVAAALRAKATILWTEDLQDGQRFDRVTVRNPVHET